MKQLHVLPTVGPHGSSLNGLWRRSVGIPMTAATAGCVRARKHRLIDCNPTQPVALATSLLSEHYISLLFSGIIVKLAVGLGSGGLSQLLFHSPKS